MNERYKNYQREPRQQVFFRFSLLKRRDGLHRRRNRIASDENERCSPPPTTAPPPVRHPVFSSTTNAYVKLVHGPPEWFSQLTHTIPHTTPRIITVPAIYYNNVILCIIRQPNYNIIVVFPCRILAATRKSGFFFRFQKKK